MRVGPEGTGGVEVPVFSPGMFTKEKVQLFSRRTKIRLPREISRRVVNFIVLELMPLLSELAGDQAKDIRLLSSSNIFLIF